MSGSLGKSTSQSQGQNQSQSQQSSYGQNLSQGFNQGQSSTAQNVWQPQSSALESLYANAQGQAGQAQNNVNQMNPQLMQSWGNIMNPGTNPQLQGYQNQVMQNFNENIMPAIGDQAQMAGGFGGTRQSVAQGVAARGANQQMTDMAGNLYNQDMNRMLQGIQIAPNIANMGMQPSQTLAGIIGSPTVLGQGQSTSLGGNQSAGYNQSQGTAQSSGATNANSKSANKSLGLS